MSRRQLWTTNVSVNPNKAPPQIHLMWMHREVTFPDLPTLPMMLLLFVAVAAVVDAFAAVLWASKHVCHYS